MSVSIGASLTSAPHEAFLKVKASNLDQLCFRSAIVLAARLLLLAACQDCGSGLGNPPAPPEASQNNGSLYAACNMRPSTSLPEDLPKVHGHVLFKQEHPQDGLVVLLQFGGFLTDGEPTAVHIHQYGDLSQGCGSTGGHYNPYGEDHPNHPGDFGNFEPQEGKINAMVESKATLFGGMSALGRAVVVHEKRDDLGQGGDAGSLLHGNAGRRLACCVIGISTPDLWNTHYKELTERIKSELSSIDLFWK